MTGQVHLVQCHEISYTVYLHVAIQPRPLNNSFNYSYQRNNLKSSKSFLPHACLFPHWKMSAGSTHSPAGGWTLKVLCYLEYLIASLNNKPTCQVFQSRTVTLQYMKPEQ